MNKINKISLAALILCSISSTSAFAQDTDPNAPVAVDPAVVRAMDYNPSWYVQANADLLRPDSEFGVGEHGAGFGFAIGKPLSEDWDIQIGTKYANQRLNGLNYQQNTLGVDGLYMFSRKAIRPFILAGVGYQEDRLTNPSIDQSGYSPYVEAGVGIQAVLSDQWSLQLDFRREHGYQQHNEFNGNTNGNNYVSLGISYSFDKTPTVAVAQVAPPPPPAPIVVMAPPPPPAPAPAPRFEKIVLSSTELFSFDKSDLRMPQPKLDEIARVLNNNTQVNNIVINGYTDRIGSDKYNQKLSERRANAVKDYLVGKGISADRLTAVGKGKSDPLVTCTDKKLSK